MRDLLPAQYRAYLKLTELFFSEAARFGFQPIELPAFEQKSLFIKGVGEETDIVSKEMYDLYAHGEDLGLALRPEGTASVVRAYIEHGMHSLPQPVRLCYAGPMWRHERPQKGRYRQFYQLGLEVLGSADAVTDAQLALFLATFSKKAGLSDIQIRLGSTGDSQCRPAYEKKLRAYFTEYQDVLCADCLRRLEVNPLRLLDCKESACQAVAAKAPLLLNNLCADCQQHFKQVTEAVEQLGVPYELDPTLVRGLDYYTRTVIEATASAGGHELAIAGGGRYDNLVGLYGGPKTPASGLSIGLDRLVEALDRLGRLPEHQPSTDVCFILLGPEARAAGLGLYKTLSDLDLSVALVPDKDSLRAQLKAADQLKARYAVIIGQQEVVDKKAILRELAIGSQETISLDELPERLSSATTSIAD